jgi:hypothetical protein
MLLLTVIVAGYRACANINLLPDIGVADIREVAHFDPCSQAAVLDLTEISNMNPLAQVSALAQMRERANIHLILQNRSFNHRVLNAAIRADGRITYKAIWADDTSHTYCCIPD